MGRCEAKTKKGLQCKRPASNGSKFCSTHGSRPGDLSRDQVVRDVSEFVDLATDDLLTLAVMKAQYCDKSVPSNIKDRMAKLETTLTRILRGSKGPPAIPGLDNLLKHPTMRSAELTLMRRKFVGVFRELTGLLVEHCKIKSINVSLPDITIDVKFPSSVKGCGETPKDLLAWFRERRDAVWKDKQILCLAAQDGERVNLPVGHILHDGFVVVHNVDQGLWYGVARPRKKQSWARRLLELLKRKCKEAVKSVLKGLWSTIVNSTMSVVTMIAWQRLLVTIFVAVVTGNSWVLTFLPKSVIRLCFLVIRSVFGLAKRALGQPSQKITQTQTVAIWYAASIVSETCPFVPQRQLALPPGTRLPMIAPPPLSPLSVNMSPGPWNDMLGKALRGMGNVPAEWYIQLLLGGVASIAVQFLGGHAQIIDEFDLVGGLLRYIGPLDAIAETALSQH